MPLATSLSPCVVGLGCVCHHFIAYISAVNVVSADVIADSDADSSASHVSLAASYVLRCSRPFSKAISSAIYNGSWQLTTDS